MPVKFETAVVLILSIAIINFVECKSINGNEREIGNRIVGGNTAPPGAFPFQVSLRNTSNSHFCGGALISDRWVVSAASCVYGKLPGQVLIVVGADSIWDGTIYDCESITRHELFDSITLANDLAVLKTRREVLNSTYVAPTFYYRFTYNCNQSVTTAVWGDIQSGGGTHLQYLNLTTTTNIGCRAMLSNYSPANDIALSTSMFEQFCALGTYNSGSSICNGDKGAPIFTSQSRVVLGVLSFATCTKRAPAIFTSVGYYQDWILDQTNVAGVFQEW